MIDIGKVVSMSGEFRTHPLGFFYLVVSGKNGTNQRVHVWLPQGPDRPENDRHQHSFDIHSSVMLGRMRSELFRFVEREDGDESEFHVTYGDGRSVLTATGRRGTLEPIATFESSVGNSYYLQAGAIHCVAVIDRPCITVLDTVERGIPIFSYGSDAEEPPFERRMADASEAREIARLLESVSS